MNFGPGTLEFCRRVCAVPGGLHAGLRHTFLVLTLFDDACWLLLLLMMMMMRTVMRVVVVMLTEGHTSTSCG